MGSSCHFSSFGKAKTTPSIGLHEPVLEWASVARTDIDAPGINSSIPAHEDQSAEDDWT
jgi:hypothetical protein